MMSGGRWWCSYIYFGDIVVNEDYNFSRLVEKILLKPKIFFFLIPMMSFCLLLFSPEQYSGFTIHSKSLHGEYEGLRLAVDFIYIIVFLTILYVQIRYLFVKNDVKYYWKYGLSEIFQIDGNPKILSFIFYLLSFLFLTTAFMSSANPNRYFLSVDSQKDILVFIQYFFYIFLIYYSQLIFSLIALLPKEN